MTRKKDKSSSSDQMWRKIIGLLIAIGLVIAAWLGLDLPDWATELLGDRPTVSQPAPSTTSSGSTTSAPVARPVTIPEGAVAATLIRAVDGDTAEVLVNGQTATVRYVGIDTPERGEPGYQAAQRANRRLMGDGDLFLVPDRSDKDRYGRLLRFIYTADGVFVNREMVAQGYAQPIEYRPDVTLADDFRQVAREAAEARRGFWGGSGDPDGAMSYALTLEDVTLRAGPGSSQTTVQQVPQGTSLTVYGRDQAGRWLQVRTPDRAGGWLQTNKVFLNVPTAQIGVVNASGVVEAPATTRAATATPIPTPAPAVSDANIDGVVLRVVENSGFNEVLELRNTGRQTVQIGGWELSGSIGNEVCTIPSGVSLRAGQSYQIVSGRSEVTANGFKCTGSPIWNNTGETIYLRGQNRQIEIDSTQQ
ncbi:MAG: thermonuclease family protein [Caldilineaceae bacterium]|nr:thermonuclease family protein [Caldilineaceae bacterium]